MNAERLLLSEPQAESELAPTRIPYHEMPYSEERQIPIKAYFKYELAALYGVSMPTFVKYINLFLPDFEAIGYNKHLQRLTPKMVELLFEKVGRV
jgi:hypothetical protein